MPSEMEKTTTATVVRNKVHIPDDLVFSILSKLPIKSLQRFTCVRKSWSLLFQNHNFMNMFRYHFLSTNNNNNSDDCGDTFLLIQQPEMNEFGFYLFSGDNDKFENCFKLDLPPPFAVEDHHHQFPYILGSVSINGIFCLVDSHAMRFRALLWNPATNEYTVIPPSPAEIAPPRRSIFYHFQGFGYDNIRDDYKLMRRIILCSVLDLNYENNNLLDEPFLEIYSLKSKSWRKLEIDMKYYSYCMNAPQEGTGAYTNGVCHWWGLSEDYTEECLVSFDLSDEVFFTTPYPSYMGESCKESCGHFMMRHLVVLNGSIALFSNCKESTTFHISILGELGVMKSWIKLFIVGPIHFVERPIGVGKTNKIAFRKKDNDLVWVDLRTQIIDEVGVKGEWYCCQIGIYKENLLPIGGINT